MRVSESDCKFECEFLRGSAVLSHSTYIRPADVADAVAVADRESVRTANLPTGFIRVNGDYMERKCVRRC